MIVFDLHCDSGHRFEGWFGSSTDFAAQQERGLVSCPRCGSLDVTKAPMAPAVGRKGNQLAAAHRQTVDTVPDGPANVANRQLPPEVTDALMKLAEAQNRALRNSKWVGEDFAETTRAMHYGERVEEAIHGQASLEEAQALIEEGISVAPLPFPIAPPDEVN